MPLHKYEAQLKVNELQENRLTGIAYSRLQGLSGKWKWGRQMAWPWKPLLAITLIQATL